MLFLPASCIGGVLGCAFVQVLRLWSGPARFVDELLVYVLS